MTAKLESTTQKLNSVWKTTPTKNETHETHAIGDRVLVKRTITNKTDSRYDLHPLIVRRVNGDQISAERNDGPLVKRNISHFKPFNSTYVKTTNQPHHDFDDDLDDRTDNGRHHRRPQNNHHTDPTRRSQRDRRPPDRYGFSVPS